MKREEFKRGDTFELAGDVAQLVEGEELTFAGVTIAAWVMPDTGQGQPVQGTPIAQIVGAWLDQDAGLYHVLVAKEDTASWPIGDAVIDVALTWPDGRRLTTPTMAFRIVERGTHQVPA